MEGFDRNSEQGPQGPHNQSDEVRLVTLLAIGTSIREAAELCHVSESTIYRRRKDPEFRRQVSEIRASLIDLTAGRLAHYSARAADTLAKLLEAESDGIKLGAARGLLDQTGSLAKVSEMEERLRLLEEQLKAQAQAQGVVLPGGDE